MEEGKVNGASHVIQCLKKLGVTTVFSYPGGAILPVYDALYGSGLKHILTRHEQAAIHGAEGYARASGEVVVVFATSGPGAPNLVTGLADAYMDSIPLVVITGQVAKSLLGKDGFQEVGRMNYTFSMVVNNDPGVLLRVSGIFARRGYNISSLDLKESAPRNISHMKVTAICTENEAHVLVGQLKKLIDVLQVNI